MRRFLVAAMLASVLLVSVSAESAVIDSKGAFALQFGLGQSGSFGVGGVVVDLPNSGYYGFGAKYFVADKLGLGGGFYLAGNSVDADNSDFWFGIRPELSYTLVKKGSVALYTGGYLSFGIRKKVTAGTGTATNVFGLGGRIGAEWAFAEGVSVAAEYNLGFSVYDALTYWGFDSTRAYLSFYL